MSDNWSAYRDYWDNHARSVGAEQAVTGLGDDYDQVIGDVLRQVAPREVINIFDFGCGAGKTYPIARKMFPNAYYQGYDISAELIRYCREKYPFGEFEVLRHKELPFADEWIDLLICHSVLTHIFPDDAMEYLHEIKRVLSSTGRASISIHTDTTLNWQGNIARIDYRPDYFEGMLADAGLTIYNRIEGNQLVYGVGK